MAVVPIRIVGDPVLNTPTAPVPVGADGSLPTDLAELIASMYDTMDAAHGVGLAANQIGYGLRLFVYDCADDRGRTDRRRGVVINPVLETSEIPETMPDPAHTPERPLGAPVVFGLPNPGVSVLTTLDGAVTTTEPGWAAWLAMVNASAVVQAVAVVPKTPRVSRSIEVALTYWAIAHSPRAAFST